MKYIVILLLSLIVYMLPQQSSAISVPVNYTDSWNYYRLHKRGGCGGPPDFKAQTLFGMSLDKQFTLQAQGIRNLNQNESGAGDIPVGTNLLAYNDNVTGSYWYAQVDNATPPMDNNIYNWNYMSSGGDCSGGYEVQNQMRGGIIGQVGHSISSSDPSIIDCASAPNLSRGCTTKREGVATLTVSWPGSGSYYVERNYQWGSTFPKITYEAQVCTVTGYTFVRYSGRVPITKCSCPAGTNQRIVSTGRVGGQSVVCIRNLGNVFTAAGGGYAREGWGYSLNPITYTVRVKNPNQAPTVAYTGTTGIGYNTATANWSYSDVDGDAQTNAAVQIATDPGFTNIVWGGYAGTASNIAISGLIPGTTYYPRVAAYNPVNGWTGWLNGVAFSTKVNNPPNLDQLSCGGTGTGYTTGNINWNYTGTDEPGDELVLKAKWRREGEVDWVWDNLPYNTRTGNIDISGLISGYEYDIQVSLNDNRNSNLGDRWKGCGRFTTTEYPEPSVDFNLKSGSTTVAKGETLTIKTGDPISTNWKITNTDGLNPSSCALSTEGVRTIFNESGLGFGPDSRQNNNVEPDKADQTYTINLSCTGKEAKVPRSVNANITLVIQSYPLISCRVVNTKVVSAERPTAEVEGTIGNANPQYTWRIKRTIGENYGSPITSDSTTQKFTLDYTGLGLGKYNPVIEAKGSLGRTAEKTCTGDITNFGDRSIREVAK